MPWVRRFGAAARVVLTPSEGRARARGLRRLVLAVSIAVTALAFEGGAAHAHIVRGTNGRLYGILPKPNARAPRDHPFAKPGDPTRYFGGSVMLSTSLHLIFWGPPGRFDASYQGPITQWAKDLAADSGKTTSEFSVASVYYTIHPRRQITKDVYFGGAVSDLRPYPRNGCLVPDDPRGICLSDAQLQREIGRVIAAQHWPKDNSRNPRNQYLLFMPADVASCKDNLDTQCTFSDTEGFCAYHSSFAVGRKAVVYSIMPDIPECGSGQAPPGVGGNPDTDATLDSAVHEVLESATDPGSQGSSDWGWATDAGDEIGDLCSPQSGALYGVPLGGSLGAHTAFNQLIAGHGYYTQEIWAAKTPSSPAAGCVQRAGPSPVFTAPRGRANTAVAFDGSQSYDLVGGITTYAWYYGDGSPIDTTSGSHGVHVYAHPGVYQVTLIVEDASGAGNAQAETQTEVVS